ncbi:MAG: hypothetical protein K6U00_02050, partial [Armatimonadetes bacterium]|nr:hypothetical protein [Armatimonadota bacterium]
MLPRQTLKVNAHERLVKPVPEKARFLLFQQTALVLRVSSPASAVGGSVTHVPQMHGYIL